MTAVARPWSEGSAKTFWRGTHRTVPPEVTLDRVTPLLPAMGITRVGVITGLDTIGLPVAQATRPNSRAVAVSLGKGATVAAAKVSAIMEAAETYHAETVTGPLRWAAARDIEGAVDPRLLPASAAATAGEPLADARLLWIAGTDLMSGAERWVPFELVHTDYTVAYPEPQRFLATTNGLASGNVPVEAQLHALCEVVERHAIARWRDAGGPEQSAARPIDLQRVDDPDISALLERITAAGIAAAAWDVTGHLGVPVFVALLVPQTDGPPGAEAELGSGAHLDAAVALSRALTEAAQTRLARIAGARDDFEPRSWGPVARQRRHAEARDWLALGRRSPVRWQSVRAAFTLAPGSVLEADLDTVLGALCAVGVPEAVWVDLSRAEIGLPVGRVIVPGLGVPGLEGPWPPVRSLPDGRAKAAWR